MTRRFISEAEGKGSGYARLCVYVVGGPVVIHRGLLQEGLLVCYPGAGEVLLCCLTMSWNSDVTLK